MCSHILVQYAFRLFVNSTSGTDSTWFKSLKACLRTNFHFYFDQKISEYQKNAILVSCNYKIVMFVPSMLLLAQSYI